LPFSNLRRILVLEGAVVLDLSLQLPGPYATMLLRGLGARVIKVEPPTGDPARHIDPPMFRQVNAGKELLALDLKQPAGREVIYRLVEHADAFIEGFRPGVVNRLGVDYERLRTHNPRLVYCSLSGFGQTGPYARIPGHDLNYLAVGGGAIQDEAIGQHSIGIPMVDLAAGSTAALLMVAGMWEASRTGQGRFLDVAMLDAAVVWSFVKLPPTDIEAGAPEPTYGVFPASDGERIAVAVLEDPMWQRLCTAFGWDDWLNRPELAEYRSRQQHGHAIAERLRGTLLTRPAAEWLEIAAQYDLPVTPVRTHTQVPDDPQVAARQLFLDGQLQPPFPATARMPVRGAPGEVGADRDAVLWSFGWSAEQISAAEAADAFGRS
jgi:crotonobetainyl-CoA:carnitine CoA-transferase CaiB-like acyl-CoA transferase